MSECKLEDWEFFLLVNDLEEIDQRIVNAKLTMRDITEIKLQRITKYVLTIQREDKELVMKYDVGKTPFTGSVSGAFYDNKLWNTALYVFDADAYEVEYDIKKIVRADE